MDGNDLAYRYLYDNHYVALCHVANEYVHDHFTAETIVDDAIFHLWEIRDKLNIATSLRSYLLKAVRNRCLNHLEANKKNVSISSELEESKGAFFINDAHPLGSLLDKELEEEISAAINRLPEDTRRVFEMSKFDGKKYEEIAAELGISVNTVKYHIKKSLSSLRNDLSKYLFLMIMMF